MKTITLKTLFERDSLVVFGKILVPVIVFLGLVILFATGNDIKFYYFSQDPIQTLNAKPYIGLISNLGILFWCATASILIFSSILLRRTNAHKISGFLMFSGMISMLLLIDDLFMFHETVSEALFFGIYFFSLIALIIFHHQTILGTDYMLWLVSFILLSASVIIDLATRFGLRLPHSSLVEDSAKFLGIIMWFAYFARTSFRYIKT